MLTVRYKLSDSIINAITYKTFYIMWDQHLSRRVQNHSKYTGKPCKSFEKCLSNLRSSQSRVLNAFKAKKHRNCAFYYDTWKSDNGGQNSLGHLWNYTHTHTHTHTHTPIQCWNSGEIACTRFQHCRRGGGGRGRGWTSVEEFVWRVWKSATNVNLSQDFCPWL